MCGLNQRLDCVGLADHIRAMFFEKQGVVQNEAASRCEACVCFVLFFSACSSAWNLVAHLVPAPSDRLHLCRMAKETGLVGQGHTCANKDIALPECFRASNWNKGWVGEIFSDIVKETAVNVVALTAANFSASSAHVSTDDFSRCIWEVKEGKVDVCVGDIWETEPRRRFTSFSSALDVDVFKIVTKTSTRPFRAVQLLNFSKPFEWQLWLVTCTMVVFGGICRRLAFSLPSQSSCTKACVHTRVLICVDRYVMKMGGILKGCCWASSMKAPWPQSTGWVFVRHFSNTTSCAYF